MPPKKKSIAQAKKSTPSSETESLNGTDSTAPAGGLPPGSGAGQPTEAQVQNAKSASAAMIAAQECVRRILDHDAFSGVTEDLPAAIGSNKFSSQENSFFHCLEKRTSLTSNYFRVF